MYYDNFLAETLLYRDDLLPILVVPQNAAEEKKTPAYAKVDRNLNIEKRGKNDEETSL